MEPSTPSTRPSSAKRIYKVVLTGGPCGGKTTGQSRLCTFFENLGWKVYRVPETATILLGGGIKFADLSEAETHKFQENLLLAMLQIETVFMELAESCKKNCLIICDRGTMDASAFISPQAWDGIMLNNHFNPVELRDNRYNQIIHMVSAAVGAEDFYSIDDHVVRSENLELACELDRKAAQAWIGHPYFDVIDNTSDFDTKIKRMISMVCQKIGVETGDRLKNNARKMKYFVAGPMPPDDYFPKFQDFTVEHVYLRTNSRKMQARIRKRGADGNHSYTYTIRKPEKLGQIVEVRTQVTQRDWNTAKGQADDQHFPVYKTRRCFLHNDQYFQLDIYRQPCHSRCEGLMLLETYSTLTGDEMKQRLPSFLNVMEEVTGNPKYSMFNLSLRDDWSNTTKFCHNIAGKEDTPASTTSSSNNTTTSNTTSTSSNTNTVAASTVDEDVEGNRRKWTDNCSSDWLSAGVSGGGGGGEERRNSECGGSEWDYYQNKIAKSLPPPRPDVCHGEDDKFYEDMDKRYNGNRRRKEMMKKKLLMMNGGGGSEGAETNGDSMNGSNGSSSGEEASDGVGTTSDGERPSNGVGGASNGCSNGEGVLCSREEVASITVNGKEDSRPKQTVVGI